MVRDLNIIFFRVSCLLEKSSQREIIDARLGLDRDVRFYTVRNVLGADLLGSDSNLSLVIMRRSGLHYLPWKHQTNPTIIKAAEFFVLYLAF